MYSAAYGLSLELVHLCLLILHHEDLFPKGDPLPSMWEVLLFDVVAAARIRARYLLVQIYALSDIRLLA